MFVEALILNHFDLECYIQIKTVISSCVIDNIFNELISDVIGQWYHMVFFS